MHPRLSFSQNTFCTLKICIIKLNQLRQKSQQRHTLQSKNNQENTSALMNSCCNYSNQTNWRCSCLIATMISL